MTPNGPQRESRLASRSVQAAFLIVLVVLWYLATTRWGVSSILLPNPVLVVQQLWDILKTGEFIGDLRVTLTELGIAFAISSTSGIIVGYLISRSHYRIRVFEPLFAGIYSVPIILFLPLYVLFFGLGPASKIALGATISFFPIVLNTIAGFGYVDRVLIVSGALDGRVRLPAVPLRAAAGGAADHPDRHAHGLHRGAALHHRQRDHRVAGGARPPHRASRRRHGDAAHVRLYRLRRGHRAHPQHHRVRARGAGKAAHVMPAGKTLPAWLRRPWVARIGVVLALFVVWEIAARWWVDPMFLSPPSRVLMSLQAVFDTRGVPAALRITFWELGVAFAMSVVIGLVIGLAVGLQPFARKSFMPIILLLYGTPQVTILPLFILYFGIGPASKIAFGVSHGIFPIIMTIVAGVQNIKPILLTSARSMGASRWQILRHVIFPHMIPSFFAGMRLGMTGVLLGVLLAELYVSTAGIGYFTTLFTQNFDPTRLLGLVAVLAAMAIALNEIVRRAEVHFSRWHNS